jgi:hypothetical protein
MRRWDASVYSIAQLRKRCNKPIKFGHRPGHHSENEKETSRFTTGGLNLLLYFKPFFKMSYSITTRSLPLRPNTSGEYISSALAGGTTNVPGVVARV